VTYSKFSRSAIHGPNLARPVVGASGANVTELDAKRPDALESVLLCRTSLWVLVQVPLSQIPIFGKTGMFRLSGIVHQSPVHSERIHRTKAHALACWKQGWKPFEEIGVPFRYLRSNIQFSQKYITTHGTGTLTSSTSKFWYLIPLLHNYGTKMRTAGMTHLTI
jgi:hypothetical protein